MSSFARDHNAGGRNWHFLSGDAATMETLTSAVGFSFFSSASGFDHLAQITVIDKTGRIYRQIYGSDFGTPRGGRRTVPMRVPSPFRRGLPSLTMRIAMTAS